MSIVIYTNRKSGCRYAYESTYRYDPEKGQSRPKRKYLGRVDDDGNIIPSSHRRGGARERGPLTLARASASQAPSVASPAADAAELGACRERIRRLEAEVEALRGALDSIRALATYEASE